MQKAMWLAVSIFLLVLSLMDLLASATVSLGVLVDQWSAFLNKIFLNKLPGNSGCRSDWSRT